MKNKLLVILTTVLISFLGLSLQAQEAANSPATEANKKEDVQKVSGMTLGDMWVAGGITMYPLGFCAIAGTAIAIVNFISIRPVKFAAPKDIKALSALLNELKVDDAIAYCEKNPSPLTNIVGSGLARVIDKERNWDSIEDAMEESSIEEMAGPYVMVNYLALIASISPMLGLFGTVSGMVKAFNTIAAEGAGSASKLADNISEALITTAAGMIIGMPAMFFFFFFKNKFGAIISGASRIIGDLIFTLKMSSKYGPQDVSEMVQDEQEAVKEG